MARRWGCLPVLLVLGLGLGALVFNVDREQHAPRAIAGAATQAPWSDPAFTPAAVAGSYEPNPFLAAGHNGTMHGEGYQSDAHEVAGPIGSGLEVRSRAAGNRLPRQCATFVYRSDGKLVTMCGGVTGFRMVLIDPTTLNALATWDLPIRSSTFEALVHLDPSYMMSDSSGGAYMFLDNRDRLVFANAKARVQRIVAREDHGRWRFELDGQWDLSPYIPHDCRYWNNWFPRGECDKVTTVMPDHNGLLWWTTRNGRLGTLDPASGRVRVFKLAGEEIQNALAMDASAVYVLSDHAQYAFRAGADGTPTLWWRAQYDRGSARKVGSIDQGSGTTPTLIGARWIAFADNADGRINAVVMRRDALKPGERRELCKVPLFREGASATDNSMIGWGRSILIENNAGYESAHTQRDWRKVAGGVMRIDIRADESGCDVVWSSPIHAPSSVAKLAAGNGLAYFYTFDLAKDGAGRQVIDWSLVGLDFKTGKVAVRIPTGRGKGFDNNWSSLSLSPQGELYAGTTGGLVQVRHTM